MGSVHQQLSSLAPGDPTQPFGIFDSASSLLEFFDNMQDVGGVPDWEDLTGIPFVPNQNLENGDHFSNEDLNRLLAFNNSAQYPQYNPIDVEGVLGYDASTQPQSVVPPDPPSHIHQNQSTQEDAYSHHEQSLGYHGDTPLANLNTEDFQQPAHVPSTSCGPGVSLFSAPLSQQTSTAASTPGYGNSVNSINAPPSFLTPEQIREIRQSRRSEVSDALANVQLPANFSSNGDIPEFPPRSQPIPSGISLVEICQQYPNHLRGELLDEFMKHRWSHLDIWKNVTDEAVQGWVALRVIGLKTKDKHGFLSNRLRNRREHLKRKGVDLKELEKSPKLYTSGIGQRHGMRCIGKPSEPSKAAVKESKVIPITYGTNYRQQSAGDTSLRAQNETNASKDCRPPKMAESLRAETAPTANPYLRLRPDQTDPCGAVFGTRFWVTPQNFDVLICRLNAVMKDCEAKTTDLLENDASLVGEDKFVKLDRKLALLGWDSKSRKPVMEYFEHATPEQKVNHKVVMSAFISDLGLSWLDEDANKWLSKLNPETISEFQSGAVDRQIVRTMRNFMVSEFFARVDRVHQNVQSQWNELKREETERQLAADLSTTGDAESLKRKRKRAVDEEVEDEVENKKVRLQGDSSVHELGSSLVAPQIAEKVLSRSSAGKGQRQVSQLHDQPSPTHPAASEPFSVEKGRTPETNSTTIGGSMASSQGSDRPDSGLIQKHEADMNTVQDNPPQSSEDTITGVQLPNELVECNK
jgi:hypothetical protein